MEERAGRGLNQVILVAQMLLLDNASWHPLNTGHHAVCSNVVS